MASKGPNDHCDEAARRDRLEQVRRVQKRKERRSSVLMYLVIDLTVPLVIGGVVSA